MLVRGDQAPQHWFAGANLGELPIDRSRRGLPVERDIHAVGLKEDRSARVVADHLLALLQYELERFVHRLARRVLDELVHQRVTGGFPS